MTEQETIAAGKGTLGPLVVCPVASDKCPSYCKHQRPHTEDCECRWSCRIEGRRALCVAHNAGIERPMKPQKED
jgi:hypothetical protein